jgi:type IV pilus assembly protein PilM
MEILPKALGTRPRLAVEIRWGGVVAARSEDASTGVLAAVSWAELPIDAVEPGLRAGNFRIPGDVVGAVRKTLEAVTEKGVGREVTLIVPDSTVRVLLLDFDSLPAKVADALPVVRFRLKKLLPFDADDAVVSYQIMAGKAGGSKGSLRVAAVAIPREVLAEYEAVVREAGFEPGAVLSSTLAAISGLGEEAEAALLVNAGPQAVTTAIVHAGVLLLHRSVDMSGNLQVGILAEATVTMTDAQEESITVPLLPLIDVEDSQQEWAMQEPVDPFGRDVAEQQGLRRPIYAGGMSEDALVAGIEAEAAAEAAAELATRADEEARTIAALRDSRPKSSLTAAELSEQGYLREVTQAISVAAAYYEDTLEKSPGVVLSAGSVSAHALGAMLAQAGFGEMMDVDSRVRVREVVGEESLAGQAVSSTVPKSWLAGVRGALRS